MAVFDLKRIVFWSICFSPTLLMFAILIYTAVLSSEPCVGRGCALGEAVTLMALFVVFVMTWIAHAIEAIIIAVIKVEETSRTRISCIAGRDYSEVKTALILWPLIYPFAMWVLMEVVFSYVANEKAPSFP